MSRLGRARGRSAARGAARLVSAVRRLGHWRKRVAASGVVGAHRGQNPRSRMRSPVRPRDECRMGPDGAQALRQGRRAAVTRRVQNVESTARSPPRLTSIAFNQSLTVRHGPGSFIGYGDSPCGMVTSMAARRLTGRLRLRDRADFTKVAGWHAPDCLLLKAAKLSQVRNWSVVPAMGFSAR